MTDTQEPQDSTAIDVRSDPTVVQITGMMPALVQEARGLTITPENSAEMLPVANEIAARCARVTKAVKALKARFVAPFKVLIKKIEQDLRDDIVTLNTEADTLVRNKLGAWEVTRRQIEREAQRKADAAALQVAEDEKIEQAVQLENVAAATGDEHYRRLADETLEQPVRVRETSAVKPAPPKLTNVSFRMDREVTVDNLRVLARAVADGTVNQTAIAPNMTWLKAEATQRGDEFSVPGCTSREKAVPVVRS